MDSTLGLWTQLLLRLQSILSYGFTLGTYHFLSGWMKFSRGYRIRNLKQARVAYRQISRENPGPMLICANHLTLIDSLLLIWAFAPSWRYLLHPRWMAWNVPESKNVKKMGPFIRAITYLGRCLLIERQGAAERKDLVLRKIKDRLEHGHRVMIFPEGGRSRTGRVDVENVTYGVGRILQSVPECQVLCVYLRGDQQADYSDYPEKNDRFTIDLKLIRPHSSQAGLRGQRDLSLQVIHELASMEKNYFEKHAPRSNSHRV